MNNKKNKNQDINYLLEEDSQEIEKKIKKTKKELKKCQQERSEYLSGWQRARADLINHKNEQEKKALEYYKFANKELILEIIDSLDGFERALKHVSGKEKENIDQLYKYLKNILKNNGLEEIEAIGKKFNPEFHETVGEIKSRKLRGTIIEEDRKGYKLHKKVIRPSKVKISK